jgi:alkylhydroperoxidase family enzyme
VPNEATDEHFARLRRWYSDEEIVEIVGVIAAFGWLNRWNDTMATTLEDEPMAWARKRSAGRP